MRSATRIMLVLFIAVIAYSIALASEVTAGNPTHMGSKVITQILAAFILMYLVWKQTPKQPSALLVTSIIIVGIIARCLLIFIEPYTSNDIDRYLFDGRIALEGLDPYQVAHDAPELAALRAQWAPPDEHAKYATLYPPLALGLYTLAAMTGVESAALTWKLFTTLASVSLCILGFLALRKAQRLQHISLLALNPLLILEAGESAHVDIFSALCVLAAIVAWQHRRSWLTGVAIGIGACIKLLPLLLLIPIALSCKTWRSFLQINFGTAVSLGMVYGISLVMGLKPIGSITVFFEKWRASSPLFYWLEPQLGQTAMVFLVLSLATISLLAIAVWSWHLREQKNDQRYLIMQASMAVPLMLSPVVFSWYLMPILAVFALRPNLIIAAWMITLPLSYEVLNLFLCCGVWQPAGWAVTLIGLALVLSFLCVALPKLMTFGSKHKTKPELRHHLVNSESTADQRFSN